MISMLWRTIQALVDTVERSTECEENRYKECNLSVAEDTGCKRCQTLSHLRHAAYLSKTAVER